jgi:hypothetical protein
MTNNDLRGRFYRFVAAVAVGGSAFQLSGCDPAVREQLLCGLEVTTQSLSSALISAFFLTLEDDDAADSSGITNP